jgi:hypothetical protein
MWAAQRSYREKPYEHSDGNGLHRLVQPSGKKLGRLQYRFAGKPQQGPADERQRKKIFNGNEKFAGCNDRGAEHGGGKENGEPINCAQP